MGNYSYIGNNVLGAMEATSTIGLGVDYDASSVVTEAAGGGMNYKVIVPAAFGCIFLIGIVGNSLVIMVTSRRLKGLHKTMNVFILNLSFADLLFLVFCVPFSAIFWTTHSWDLGEILCKLLDFLTYMSMLASIFTLVAMSLDRFSAVVFPLKLLQLRSLRNAKIIVVMIWIVSFSCASPYLVVNAIVFDSSLNVTYCVEKWPNVERQRAIYYAFMFTVGYVLPLFLITCAYVLILRALWKTLRILDDSRESNSCKAKRKVTVMVSVVVLVFGVCWLPHHVIYMWQSFGNFPYTIATAELKLASLCLSYLNSCLNPIIYSIMSENFRKAMMRTLQKCGSDPLTNAGSGGRGVPGIRLTPVTQNNQFHYQKNTTPDTSSRYYPRRNLHRHRLCDANGVHLMNGQNATW
ncbi:galanin receptor type 1-like [Diadema antillarum]|uniref:galanin receptor type 1-like n=1 Tax=Diadema antillarum TaxID=105358 RepID=UPI003A87EBC8